MTTGSATGGLVGLAAACGLLLVVLAMTAPARPRSGPRVGPVTRLAKSAELPWVTPAGLVVACCATALTAGALALVVSTVPVVALIASVVAAAVPVFILRRRAAQRERAIRTAWPEAIDALVSAVRAGMSLPESVGALAEQGPVPLRPAFAQFVAEQRASGSFTQAVHVLEDRLADPVADRVVASLLIAVDVGGSDLGRVLRTLSAMLREDARMRGEIEGRQSWTVSAARMAVAAPWITLALLCTRPEAVQAYRTTVGACVILAAAAVSVVAYRLMMRIGRLPAERRLAP